MNCKLFEEIAIDLIRKPGESDEAVIHLKECNNCARYLQQQRNLTAGLKILAEEDSIIAFESEMPPSLSAGLRPQKLWMKAAVFFVALSLAIVGYYFHNIAKETRSQITRERIEEPALAGTAEDGQAYTEFVPLMPGEPAPDLYQVVRVKLPRSSLLQFGLPVNPERGDEAVTADLVVGENGMPHAIRFVNDSQ